MYDKLFSTSMGYNNLIMFISHLRILHRLILTNYVWFDLLEVLIVFELENFFDRRTLPC